MNTPYHTSPDSDPACFTAGAETVGGTNHSSAPTSDAPRTVIRGESLSGTTWPTPGDIRPLDYVPATAALTDWLNCTFPLPDTSERIDEFFQDFLACVGPEFAPPVEIGKGLHGWKRSFSLGATSAVFAIGGQRGKAFLSLPGTSCMLIAMDAWPTLVSVLRDHYNATITRWDGAVDDFEGVHSVDWAVEQYLNNGFNAGGNRPSCKQVGNWIQPDGSGRTFYVGKRKNGKVLRTYEKGKQLGDPTSPWVRWELELHNRDRVIPWDVIANPGGYVAGAYPCTAWIIEEACRIRTTQNAERISYKVLTHYARQAYGRHINVMLEVEGSPEKVIERLRREGKPSRLSMPRPPEFPDDNKINNEDVW